jgi:hypothetical protein
MSVPTGACCGVTLIEGRLRVDFWGQAPSPTLLKDWTAAA